MYWKQRFKNLTLTIGKQPVSWFFGLLLNPVDYTLEAVALERDYNSKYQNALEIYIPINWNNNLLLVTSLLKPNLAWKAGLRGRTLIKDFGITFNCIQEQLRIEETGGSRLGIIAKGDLGPFDVYSVLGYCSRDYTNPLLAGLDYSYFFPAGDQFYIRSEYLNISPEILSKIIDSMSFSIAGEGNIHLLTGNITYKIDEFSSIGLTMLYNISASSAAFIPIYSNKISNNTILKFQVGLQAELISYVENSSHYKNSNQPAYAFLEIGLTYAF